MIQRSLSIFSVMASLLLPLSSYAAPRPIPEKMQQIMQQAKYQHAFWGIHVKDSATGEVLYDLNSDKLFLPASTTKLFSVAALLHAYGDDFRYVTPLYAVGDVKDGVLNGNLVLVAQGDLTFGGRQAKGSDTIAYTKLDHIIANNVPGVILTPENPLRAILDLAKQVKDKGIKEINGDVLIDDRLFEQIEKRGTVLSPILINENLIDLVFNPADDGKPATLFWRPQIPEYTVKNEVTTVAKGGALDIQITMDESGRNIVVKGTIPIGQKDIVRTASIKNPSYFARAALIQALRNEGITVNTKGPNPDALPASSILKDLKPIASWTSPPLSEYAKLILKVSHNTGANLVPLLLAVRHGERTFDAGMKLLGDFAAQVVKLSETSFVFLDGAGGDENRLTPLAETQLLDYVNNQSKPKFATFYNALPILGVDGSLEDFAKNTPAVGKVRAKTGTGIAYNTATGKFLLTTQALAGYIEGKNGHLLEFMISVNNGNMNTIDDIFPVFEDESQMTAIIYDLSL